MIPISSKSRMAAALLLVTILGACAEHTPPPSHGFGGRHGHGGPAHGGSGPGRFFISPMGEPFHGGEGRMAVAIWFEGADADHDGRLTKAEFAADAKRFFAMLDADHDGEIDPAEITRYETEIVPQVASGGGPGGAGAGAPGGGRHGGGGQGRGGGGGHRGGGMGHGGGMGGGETSEGGGGASGAPEAPYTPQGAARYGFLGDPEPVVSADIDFDRSITLAEFVETAARRFALLDTAHQGYLTLATLPPLPGGRAGR